MEQQVILVNEADEVIGVMEKMEAHRKGLLHRAFSVFIFDHEGRMLLHQRAEAKYHGGGLWTNACCSHPFPGEGVEEAAARRLKEELGISTTLQPVFRFTYRAEVENGLTEHEYDHVFAGVYDGTFDPDPEEVAALAYYTLEEIEKKLEDEPQNFTAWFRIAFEDVARWKREGL